MNISHIKCMIFDLDNTLFDEVEYLYQVIRKYVKDYDKMNYVNLFSKDIILTKLNRRSSDILYELFKLYFNRNISKDEHDKLYEIYANANFSLKLYPDSEELINYLSNIKNYKLALLSNGIEKVQLNKIDLLGIKDKFNYICIVNGIFAKPNREGFLKILEYFNIEPNRCLMIGDDPYTDIKGAKQLGMITYRVKRGFYRNEPDDAHFSEFDLKFLIKMLKSRV